MIEDKKIGIRPIINIVSEDERMSFSEKFQNQTLRPVIKLQHDLLIHIFKQHATSRKQILKNLSDQKLMLFIHNVMQKDLQFKALIIGLIVGHFTVDEYTEYKAFSSEINRRIFSIVTQRIQDSLQELKD